VFGIDRTPNTCHHRTVATDFEHLVEDAFAQLDVPVRRDFDAADILVLDPWGSEIRIEVKRRSLVDESAARKLLRERGVERATDEPIVFFVADRVTADARKILEANNIGYLDLRGRLDLRGEGLLISANVEPNRREPTVPDPVSTPAGLEVATALLMEPDGRPGVRDLARSLDRSPSTVSVILSALAAEELVDAERRVKDERLFWRVAANWLPKREYLTNAPPPGSNSAITVPLGLCLDDVTRTTGWALADVAAAAVWGAPVATRADQTLDFYVPDGRTVKRAVALLGVAKSPAAAACSVAVAPTPAVCSRRQDPVNNPYHWPTVHPVFAALDLARDAGRGREILRDWNPSDGSTRVW